MSISWIIHDDPNSVNKIVRANGAVTEVAFDSLLNLNLGLALTVNATKHVNLSLDALNLNKFNVTKDNIGGSVKSE